ncbi:MAG TPA: hypothetical protein VFG89_09465 [Coriobacteriia bacterium]|nr:hypothetical protein [Coriobacteriia bacterium]
MAKKQPSKKQFDWKTYSKPQRLLTEVQEHAFGDGMLTPLLEWADSAPRVVFEIRPRAASIYCFGQPIVRVGGEGPFVAEFDPIDGGGAPERVPLESDSDIAALIERLETLCAPIRAAADAGEVAPNRRAYLQALAASNSGSDLFRQQFVFADIEYPYGKWRFDAVALSRSEGVTGPGGFANPMEAIIDVRVPGQSVTGQVGLVNLASALADFAKAVAGHHLALSRAEVGDLVDQKVRLGMLPEEIELRDVTEKLPELIVVFIGDEVMERSYDVPVNLLHEKLVARHYPTHRLSFAHVPDTHGIADVALSLSDEDLMDYRAFKAYRTAGR